MRRLRTNPVLALILGILAAALLPGAAVFARPAATLEKCGGATDIMPTRMEVDASDLVVIGTIASVDGDAARLAPEAFLKGPTSSTDIVIGGPVQAGCARVALHPGDRVLLSLTSEQGVIGWPLEGGVGSYRLEAGRAVSLNTFNQQTVSNAPTEAAVVDHIRSITEQYAVPATSASEGATLDWVKVVLPTALVILAVFGIGLYLMKIWHRIDPT